MRSSYGRIFAVMLALTAGGPALAAVECSSVTYCLQGNTDAMNALGEMYREGMGVPQDYVRAHMWYSLSAFVSGGRFSIGAAGRDFIVDLMTPAQIDEAQQLAREWLELRTYGLTRP